MTPNDKKLEDFWRIKPRDASGKRLRPCDFVPALSQEEIRELMALPPAQRKTGAQLRAAEQTEQAP